MKRKKTRIFWTRQAQEDLRDISGFIARDAPHTAKAFVERLKKSVDRLRTFPESGAVVPELGNPQIREVLRGSYRLIYRFSADRVDILAVFHSARLLKDGNL